MWNSLITFWVGSHYPQAVNNFIPQPSNAFILRSPPDVLRLIGKWLPRQDAIVFTSVCIQLFYLRFADTGYGILNAQYWRRLPRANEVLHSTFMMLWDQGRIVARKMVRNDAPGIMELTLDFTDSYISARAIDNVVSNLKKLSKLCTLHMNCERLSTVACLFLQTVFEVSPFFSDLTLYYLSDDTLFDIFGKIEQRHMSQLHNLTITGEFTAIPDRIGQCTDLKRLTIKSRYLSNIPVEIGQLLNLQCLKILGHYFSSLPSALGQLSNLQKLHITGHSLTALPIAIGQLDQLQRLTIEANCLAFLPVEIARCNELKNLTINGNNLLSFFMPNRRVSTPKNVESDRDLGRSHR